MIAELITVGLLGIFGTKEIVLDRFEYSSPSEARSVWRNARGTPPVEIVSEAERPVLQFRAPFASQPGLERTILDRDIEADLAAAGVILLEIRADNPEVAPQLSLYFRSGAGWYAAGARLRGEGWQQLEFSQRDFRVEGRPTGWHAIDGVRISIWRTAEADFTVQLRRLAARQHDVVLIFPRVHEGARAELQTAVRFAEDMAALLTDLGVGFDQVDDLAISPAALRGHQVVILAYHPQLPEEATRVLEKFLDEGGKLFACYSLPLSLAKRLGITGLRYRRPEEPGLAEVRFDPEALPGLPPRMRQASWNINEPIPGTTARILGFWYDRNGQATSWPAATVSENGVYFSHVLLEEDRASKRQFVAAVLGRLHPPVWEAIASRAIARARLVGHCTSADEVNSFLNRFESRLPADLGTEYRRLLAEAEHRAEAGDFPGALTAAENAREKLVLLYARAMPSNQREGRAFWNHSGTGAYPGDWERTARELAEAGFNMVLPNMLWGGLAHYDSRVLPHSNTFKKLGDQIAQCLEACHKHGIEVHVWKVNWNLSTAPAEFVSRMRTEKRLQKSDRAEEHAWLCPSHPENFQLELQSMLEVVERYPVDGIHFDYIRYPGPEYCYCEGCRSHFEAELGRPVANWPEDVRSGALREAYLYFRVARITRLVEAVAREARKLRPGIKISAAVFGGYPDCRVSVGQDWVAWIKSGYLDFVCPMDYTQDDAAFRQLVENQLRLVGGKVPVYPGIGAWRLPPDRTLGQIFWARQLGAAGFTVFDLNAEQAANLLPLVRLGIGAEPAIPLHREN
jgi:uncharacterized lipoprotein YddW (UPF0748 family)